VSIVDICNDYNCKSDVKSLEICGWITRQTINTTTGNTRRIQMNVRSQWSTVDQTVPSLCPGTKPNEWSFKHAWIGTSGVAWCYRFSTGPARPIEEPWKTNESPWHDCHSNQWRVSISHTKESSRSERELKRMQGIMESHPKPEQDFCEDVSELIRWLDSRTLDAFRRTHSPSVHICSNVFQEQRILGRAHEAKAYRKSKLILLSSQMN
jgi:hypothetical protein